MKYTHFAFTSGCNPYITTDNRERERVIAEYAGKGCKIQTYHGGLVLIDDKYINGLNPLWDCEILF